VIRNYPWASPGYVSQMYCDAKDINGVIFWYNDIVQQVKDNTPKDTPKK